MSLFRRRLRPVRKILELKRIDCCPTRESDAMRSLLKEVAMRTTRSTLCAVSSVFAILISTQAFADDRFTCWNQADKGADAAAATTYWTPARIAAAVGKTQRRTPEAMDAEDLERADVTVAPYSYGGRLLFTHKGIDYIGTAGFVLNDDTLLTAGHNVFDEGEASTNITFIRAFEDGSGTSFDITEVGILKAWEPLSNDAPSATTAAKDYAVLHTTTDSTVGKFDLETNADFVDFTLFGYAPSVGGGRNMYKLETQRVATIGDSFKAEPAGVPAGFSGGTWFIGSEAPFTAVSSTATGTRSFDRGPVFKDVTEDLFAYVRAGCE